MINFLFVLFWMGQFGLQITIVGEHKTPGYFSRASDGINLSLQAFFTNRALFAVIGIIRSCQAIFLLIEQ
jgi:hypothetical protein